MEARNEKWQSLRLEAQKFTPQEFVTQCTSTREFYVDLFDTGCSSGYVKCVSGDQTETKVHYDHSMRIRFNPEGATGQALTNFWEKAYDLINNSPDFYVYCDGSDTPVGISKVIGRGSNSLDYVTPDNIDSDWATGFCGMKPSNWGNANATVVVGGSWRELLNVSG